MADAEVKASVVAETPDTTIEGSGAPCQKQPPPSETQTKCQNGVPETDTTQADSTKAEELRYCSSAEILLCSSNKELQTIIVNGPPVCKSPSNTPQIEEVPHTEDILADAKIESEQLLEAELQAASALVGETPESPTEKIAPRPRLKKREKVADLCMDTPPDNPAPDPETPSPLATPDWLNIPGTPAEALSPDRERSTSSPGGSRRSTSPTNRGARPKRSTGLRRNASFAQSDVMKYRRAFNAFDYLKEGVVRAADLAHIVGKLGYRMPEEQLQAIMTKHEVKEDSKINFEQFMEMVPRNMEHIAEDEHRLADLREKFQRYDLKSNGYISLHEAQWALQVELKITPQTALRMLDQFVKLNYEQFVDFYSQVQAKKLEIYDKFGKYDADKDGMISVEEAHVVLNKELGYSQERSWAMVDQFDSNHDGLVSYMEFAEFYIAVEDKKSKIRQTFLNFDTEGKGYVTYEEAEHILSGMLGFSEQKCKRTMEIYDKNKDGNIDYEEFLEFYVMLEEERQRLLSEFHRYDADNDGLISFEEFNDMLTSQGYSEEEVKTLMSGYDADNDGFLNFDEFKHFLNFDA